MAFTTASPYKYVRIRPTFFSTILKSSEESLDRQVRSFHGVTARKMQDTRPPGHSQLRLDQLKLMNYTMTVDEDKVMAIVNTSGLNYSDFDGKNAQPKPYQLLKLTESARFFCHHWPLDKSGRTFRDYAKLTSDRLTFLITSRMDITEPLYNVKVPKNPLDITIQGGYVGNTSVTSIAEAFTKDGTKLLSNINQVVFVDRESRRPKHLPDWWKEKYAKSGESHKALKVDKYERPDMIEPYNIHVVRSDLDGNNHTNWSCYIRFSTDAIYNFVKNGKLLHLKDVDNRFLKSMEVMYSGESFDEDVLDVFVWSPEDNPDIAIVHILKDTKFVFQGRFEYFPVNP